jgi:hypothetical protein
VSSLSRSRAALALAAAVLISTSPLHAQRKEPIGRFAIDARGIFARHKQEPSVATEMNVPSANLPPRSYGLAIGAQVFPLRAGKVTFGFGGHVLMARGSRTLDQAAAGESSTLTPGTVRRHFRVYAPEVSFNFGHKTGWSYISGGIGRATLYLDRADAPVTDAPWRQTIHYGAGARWFNTHHVAFNVDVRWYSVAEGAATAAAVAQPRTTLLVLSGGISLK